MSGKIKIFEKYYYVQLFEIRNALLMAAGCQKGFCVTLDKENKSYQANVSKTKATVQHHTAPFLKQ